MDTPSAPLQAHALRLLESGVLGRPGRLGRLFEYLLEASLRGHRPGEVEIAVEVFGRDADFDPSQDACIRVYMHKLRARMAAYYSGPGAAEAERLQVPRGEYRLVLEPVQAGASVSTPTAEAVGGRPRRLAWAMAAALAASLGGNALALWQHHAAHTTTASPAVAGTRVWKPLLGDSRPVLLVLGDYYIFGEGTARPGQLPEAGDVQRLVRDFSINSPGELHALLARQPELSERYINLGLNYLPASSAHALRELVPVLAAGGQPVQVVMASELRLDMLKHAHVVYVGFLSGMGVLRDYTFAGSRYGLGRSYDELVDLDSRHRYLSQAGSGLDGEAMYSDYAYLAGFPGPNGNRVLVVSGTRDVAVMHAAEVLANAATLGELDAAAATSDFEALYEVNGIHHTNVRGQLLQASARPRLDIWRPEPGALAQAGTP